MKPKVVVSRILFCLFVWLCWLVLNIYGRERQREREEGDDVDGDIDGGGKQQRQQQLMIYADS